MAIFLYLIWIGLLIAQAWVIDWLAGLSLRMQERARLFLHLFDTGVFDGATAKNRIFSAGRTRDDKLLEKFQLLATYLNQGVPLSAALKEIPRFLPSQMIAMILAGEQIGDVRKVLPACRKMVTDASSKITMNASWLVIPFTLFMIALFTAFLSIKIYPKLEEILKELTEGKLPFISRLLFDLGPIPVELLAGFTLLFMGALILYVAGPWLFDKGIAAPWNSWLFHFLPWHRKRLQRDFSAMLAVLLDANMPEEKAVKLAADSTTNHVLIRRGQSVVERLRQGIKLTEAIRAFDETGEFEWRLKNAIHGKGGFLQALSGWHDALDAKAFQQEHATMQMIFTALVLFNGVIVGFIALGIFQALIAIFEGGCVW